MKNKLMYLSYDYMALKMDAMIESIREEEFSALVVIVRGGIFPGIHLSVRTGLPIYYLQYNRNMNPATINWIGKAPSLGKILLCEDMAGSGFTLIDSRSFLENLGYTVKAFVIYKDTFSASHPEFTCFETTNPKERFILPWEKSKLNPMCGFTSDMKKQDHEYEFVGWDMDGIFLADVPIEQYERDLEKALLVRDSYKPAYNAPSLGDNDVIITGRPKSDSERTHEWLQKYNMLHPLYLRDDAVEKVTSFSVALWKGRKALEIGCSKYVESDAEQAMHIANNYPHLEVVWWNHGNPICIKASSSSNIS
ncbi:phosphoribosyltransferase (plasmid) [Brevibacillus halotolerans]|nr:phosphoribosyltransferase [Brevibacillus halotolerans]